MSLSEAAKSGIQSIFHIAHLDYYVPQVTLTCYLLTDFNSVKMLDNFNRFMVIPDMLKNAPMFKRLDARIKVPFHSEVVRYS